MRRPIEQTYRLSSIMKIPQLGQSLSEDSFTTPYVDTGKIDRLLVCFREYPRVNRHNTAASSRRADSIATADPNSATRPGSRLMKILIAADHAVIHLGLKEYVTMNSRGHIRRGTPL